MGYGILQNNVCSFVILKRILIQKDESWSLTNIRINLHIIYLYIFCNYSVQ